MTNKEIFKLYRESNEPNFQRFLDENIEWVQPVMYVSVKGSVVTLKEQDVN